MALGKISSGISRSGFGGVRKSSKSIGAPSKYDAADEDTTDLEIVPPKRKSSKVTAPTGLKSLSPKSLAEVERLKRVAVRQSSRLAEPPTEHKRSTRRSQTLEVDLPSDEDFDPDDRR